MISASCITLFHIGHFTLDDPRVGRCVTPVHSFEMETCQVWTCIGNSLSNYADNAAPFRLRWKILDFIRLFVESSGPRDDLFLRGPNCDPGTEPHFLCLSVTFYCQAKIWWSMHIRSKPVQICTIYMCMNMCVMLLFDECIYSLTLSKHPNLVMVWEVGIPMPIYISVLTWWFQFSVIWNNLELTAL